MVFFFFFADFCDDPPPLSPIRIPVVTMSTLPGRAILGGLLLEMKFVLCTEWFPPVLSPPAPSLGMAGAFVRLWLGSFLMLLWILYQFCPHCSGIECYLH